MEKRTVPQTWRERENHFSGDRSHLKRWHREHFFLTFDKPEVTFLLPLLFIDFSYLSLSLTFSSPLSPPIQGSLSVLSKDTVLMYALVQCFCFLLY